MTQLKYWFLTQTEETKAAFKKFMVESCGIDERTVYRYLENQAPKLTRHLISDYTKISSEKLYTLVKVD